MRAYVQGPNGEEVELEVRTPDPEDGTYVLDLQDEAAFELMFGTGAWIRIVPE